MLSVRGVREEWEMVKENLREVGREGGKGGDDYRVIRGGEGEGPGVRVVAFTSVLLAGDQMRADMYN